MLANKKALNAYSTSIDAQVESASPHRLIVLLFDGAIKAINLAKFQMQQGNTAEKGKAISNAIAIVEEGLRLSLDKSKGGELTENLDALYEYVAHQLLTANLHNDEALLDQALILLNDLKTAWSSIDPLLKISEQTKQDDAARDGLSYGRA